MAVGAWFFAMNSQVLTKELAQKYIDTMALKKAPATVNVHAHAIMRYFRWKGERIDLECPTIPAPKPKYLSMDQVRKVIDSCSDLLESTLVIVLFDTAIRISELLGLRIEDIDWTNKFITVTRKGGRREEVNISAKALSVLKTWLDSREFDDGRVFLGLQYNDAWRMFKHVGDRAGVDFHPHMLRHSRAVQLLMAGVPLHIVKDHLGHANIATTANIYGQFKAVDIRKELVAW